MAHVCVVCLCVGFWWGWAWSGAAADPTQHHVYRSQDPYYNGEENELKAPYLDAALVSSSYGCWLAIPLFSC